MMNEITQQLVERGESADVAFIPSADARESIAQTVCGMLNSRGGTVIVGWNEENKGGTPIAPQRALRLQTYLREEISPPILFSLSVDATANGKVIVVEVPKGEDLPFVFQGGVYVRRGVSTELADARTMRRMVEEDTRHGPRWERLPSPSIELVDLDARLVEKTIASAITKRGLVFTDNEDHAQVLQELALTQLGQFTNAADVLFGTSVSQRHPQTRVRAVTYETDRAGDFVDEQLFEGPALTLLEDLMDFLRRHVAIANSFRPGQLRRETKPSYPFYSLREGLVNALVHRDYASFSGAVSVSVYPERIEIWNTGRLPRGLTPRKLEQAQHDSVLINPDISHVFYLNEFMERVGRGTYNILRECKAFGMRGPKWENTATGVRLTFFAATSAMDVIEELNDRQLALLRALKEGEQIQSSEFASRFAPDVTLRQARRDLSQLTSIGLLKRVGSGPSTAFRRTEQPIRPSGHIRT